LDFFKDTDNIDYLTGILRIVFGSIFLLKLIFTIDGYKINWATRKPKFFDSDIKLLSLLTLLFISTMLFTMGLFTGPSLLFAFLTYIYLFKYSSIYGMEDNVCHTLWMYFLLAGSGQKFSLDILFNINTWGRFTDNSLIPEILLASMLAIIFLSASIGKLCSPIWRKGLGVYYFFLLPLHRRIDTSLITRNKPAIYLLNYSVLAMELLFLPLLFLNASPIGFSILIFLFSFAVLLSTVFVFTWLGELLILGFTLITFLLLNTGNQSLINRFTNEFLSLGNIFDQICVLILSATILASLWTAIIPNLNLDLKGFFNKLDFYCRYIARYVWGFLPVNLFGERHMLGPVIYRTFAEYEDGEAFKNNKGKNNSSIARTE